MKCEKGSLQAYHHQGVYQGSFSSHHGSLTHTTQVALSQMEPSSYKESEPVIAKPAPLRVKLPPMNPGTGFHTQQEGNLCLAQGSAVEALSQEELIRTGNRKGAGLLEEPPLFGINLCNAA